jgi:UDP-N-acetylmuramate dehydrogenase
MLVEAYDETTVREAIDLARRKALPLTVLGGGSNVIVSDAGYDGMVLRYLAQNESCDETSGLCRVAAGTRWDQFVQTTIERGLAGLETTIGIPGHVGAAPVQNVGAYGQELSDVIRSVQCIDLADGSDRSFSSDECGFAYRDSRFKNEWRGRFLITAVEVKLRPQGQPQVSYRELAESFCSEDTPPTLATVAARVRQLRRAKGMLLDGSSSDLCSAGSFFTNPIVPNDTLPALRDRVAAADRDPSGIPEWAVDELHTKISAAWLIQASGLQKGYRVGRVGLSPHHVLALVNHGGATAAELLALAREVRDRVQDHFELRLRPEPVPLGFSPDELGDLWS